MRCRVHPNPDPLTSPLGCPDRLVCLPRRTPHPPRPTSLMSSSGPSHLPRSRIQTSLTPRGPRPTAPDLPVTPSLTPDAAGVLPGSCPQRADPADVEGPCGGLPHLQLPSPASWCRPLPSRAPLGSPESCHFHFALAAASRPASLHSFQDHPGRRRALAGGLTRRLHAGVLVNTVGGPREKGFTARAALGTAA